MRYPILFQWLHHFTSVHSRNLDLINHNNISISVDVGNIAVRVQSPTRTCSLLSNSTQCSTYHFELSADEQPFESGFVSPHNDYIRNFCTNNIPVAQFQTASLAEEMLSLLEGFATFDCGTYFTKIDIDVLLNAVCTE